MSNQVESVEQELTYLAASVPTEIYGVFPTRLKDVYIPDTDGIHPRLRLRRKGEEYEITKKIPLTEGDASAHIEMTIPLTKDEFISLEKTSNKTVEKDRYKVVIDGFEAEVDVFVGDLEGLIVIDFEFNSDEAKNAFAPTQVCLADVTQEMFIAGGKLAGKKYADIIPELQRFNYKALTVKTN